MNASDGDNPWQNNPPETNPQRKGKGRQKVAMEKIENETNLQVTFSKRRAGVFKKVSEISILCGAEAAVVVFSPGDKAHSFGHPDVETVANRFLNTNAAAARVDPLLVAHNDAIIRQRSQELVSVEAQLEQERQRKKELEDARRACRSQNLFPPPLDELSYEQLEKLKKSVLAFRRDFEAKLKKVATVESPHPEEGVGGGVQWAPSGGPSIGPSNQFPLSDYGPSNPMGFDVGAGGSSSSSYVPSSDANVGSHGYMVQYPHLAGASGTDFLVPYNYGHGQTYNHMQQDFGSVPRYDSGSDPHYDSGFVPHYGNVFPYGGGTSSSNVRGRGRDSGGDPMETQFNFQNNFPDFNNYGPKDY